MVDSDNYRETVESVAGQTVALLTSDPTARPIADPELTISRRALERLGALLRAERSAGEDDRELLSLYGRAVLETWLTGHTALSLGQRGLDLLARRAQLLDSLIDPYPSGTLDLVDDTVGLVHLARLLDLEMYGVADPPKAFQRHLTSFFEEIDVRGAEGTLESLGSGGPGGSAGSRSAWSRIDVIRVSLWVILFLAHDQFRADHRVQDAAQARRLSRNSGTEPRRSTSVAASVTWPSGRR